MLFNYMAPASGGRIPVALSMIECLKKLGLETWLFCGKKTDRAGLTNHFGVSVPQIDREIVTPVWRIMRMAPRMQTYLEFLIPPSVRPLCDILVNPYTSNLLPWVDITYFHTPRSFLFEKKSQKKRIWSYYYSGYRTIEKALSNNSSQQLLLANSCFTADTMKETTGVEPEVLYPPVDVNSLVYSRSDSKENWVLTIASFTPSKRLDLIPSIARRVDARFVILCTLNNKPYYHSVVNMIKKFGLKERVRILPDCHENYKVKIDLLRKAKVLLSPSVAEPFGISIVEGMAGGCIPIAHDSGGPREYVPRDWLYRDLDEAVQKSGEALDSWKPAIGEKMKSIAARFTKARFEEKFSTTVTCYLRKQKNFDSAILRSAK